MSTRTSSAPRALLLLAALPLLASSAIADGRIVLAHDEWTLSATGFNPPSDPGVFAANVVSWCTDGQPSAVLLHGSSLAVGSPLLKTALESAGHAVTYSTATLTPATAALYDVIFVGGIAPSAAVLIEYVEAGGHVYLCGGSGGFNDATVYNPFLNQFGLGFEPALNGLPSLHRPISSSHPVFAGVDALYEWNGTSLLDLDPGDPRNAILVSGSGDGLYAVYDPGLQCVGDVDGSGAVDGADLGFLLSAWGSEDLDLNGDGINDGGDLGLLLANWGPCGA